MLELGPPADTVAKLDAAPTVVAKTAQQVAMYGKSAGYSSMGQIRQGFGAVMYQLTDTSEISLLQYTGFSDYAMALGMAVGENRDFIGRQLDVISSLKTKEMLDRFDGNIYRGTLQPSQALYVPLGSFFVERTVGNSTVYGFHAPVLDVAAATRQAFGEMVTTLQSIQPEKPLANFWKSVWETLQASNAAPRAAEKKD